MNTYDKISRMEGNGSYDEKMYIILSNEKFQSNPYDYQDMGEDMSLISRVIRGWWKPRFLLDHRTKCAYEFMDAYEDLVTITDDDIDWDSLKDVPKEYIIRARNHDGHFPTLVYGFRDGLATVQWQINPDGLYYQDDDGFGGTNDREFALWGKIDRTGKVVQKFRYVPSY